MRLSFRNWKTWGIVTVSWLLVAAQVCAQSPSPTVPDAPAPTATVAGSTLPAERGHVLYPANGPQTSAATTMRGGSEPPGLPGLATSFLMLLALCGVGYYLLQRQTGFAVVSKGPRRLVVSESRSLGNRQFLVVVEYENERVLLGVTPGKIDYLCPLPMAAAASKA